MHVSKLVAVLTLGCVAHVMAAPFSLNVAEPIRKSEVPSECFAVYCAEVPSCGNSATASCTEACVDSLSALATDLQEACANAFVGMNSLLRRAVDGGLVPALCTMYEPPSEFVDSTMEAPSDITLSTLYPETKTSRGEPVPTDIETDADKPSPTRSVVAASTANYIAVDTSPAPTQGLASATLDGLFASATPSASSSTFPTADSAGTKTGGGRWLLLAGAGIVAAVAAQL